MPMRRGRTVTYADALRQVRSAAAWILAQGLSAERPLVILSDNSVDHALFALAAQHVGVPSAAISPAYSLMSRDFDKLKGMISLLQPGAIYVSGIKPFAAALAAIAPLHQAKIVSSNADDADVISFRSIAATPETPDVEKAFKAVTPDTIAKFLFTSGSTGTPKAVINTQRMLTSSQQAKAQTWTFLDEARDDLVILDWLPWSHTFGANHNFNLVLRNGGTLYVDGGKPAPGLFATSLANLRSVMPTVYFNVPRGFDMLIAALRSDDELRRKFFGEVKFAFYAGAALPQNLWDALEAALDQDGRPRAADGVGLGLDRDLAAGDRLPFPGQTLRQYRRADSRHRTEAGAVRRQARSARARPERHARLLEGAGTDRAGVRRGRFLSDRRCRDLCRSRSS